MSYFQPFSISHNNPEADDSSTVFDADTVSPDEVPSLPPQMPPLPALTATATNYHHQQQNNNETICRCPHSSQESPRSFTSEFLRLINSQHGPAEPSTTTAAATATAARSEEMFRSNHRQSSSSSSSKKRSIITNSSSHSSRKKRRSSRLKRQPQDQNRTDDKSDSEVEDENELEDYEPDEEISTNQSSSSQTSTTKQQRQNELKWRSKFEELRDYKRLHGHANVPKSNKELGGWVKTQRYEYRQLKDNKHSFMTNERIQTLESIGFEWVGQNKGGGTKDESAWNERFTELKAYKEKYGRTNVPKRWKDNKELGNWVHKQRTEYKKFKKNGKSQITSERIQKLESIRFQWEPSKWDERFNELKEYKDKYGRTNVTLSENKQLGKWVSHQRAAYKKFQANKKAAITKERIDLLNSIGFQWSCRPGCAPRSCTNNDFD